MELADPRLMQQILACKAWPLYLWGNTGRGKTCAAALAYATWQPTAYWASLAELCETLKTFNINQTQVIQTRSGQVEMTYAGFWKKLRTIGLVVIDEIGTRDAAAHRYDAMLRLLDERVGCPLILTGNLNPAKQLGQVYDDRIHSRILAGTLLEVTGTDRRVHALTERIKTI